MKSFLEMVLLIEGEQFASYYGPKPGMTVADIIERWTMKNEKMYDYFMPYMMDADDLWQYRDFTWGKEYSRGGRAVPFHVDKKQPWIQSGDERWEKMRSYMADHGWDKEEPLILTVGRTGRAKITEGNHRLAVFQSLNRKDKVPVNILFYQDVSPPRTSFPGSPWADAFSTSD